mmetsp:Transcript_18885/g.48023  ORF Transcript_18885/g.48023 Transcript_18885/m.48023 type:complete len:241 (+) Transcript_18885:98-820(+)|eukprot:CAMPEP_0177648386 /NCGR_PEP_ID=MMETSP0447-20121125/10799_1 /TAXON_ID=0 /ORGANISM="Stygamoeba regulata, Strain BSH-02190019" /LENGTH=240 /DNA_ID=CAMNT_0019151021 /DNA_START=145 /DNA_END=867 /DNA_ORIENTATION=+
MTDIQAAIGSIPPVTRTLVLGSLLITVGAGLQLLPGRYLFLSYDAVVYGFQLWRPITSIFFWGKMGIPFIVRLISLYQSSRQLEENRFSGRTADYVWMVVFGCSVLAVIGLFWPFPVLGYGMAFMIIYYRCRCAPDAPANLFGVLQFTAAYLPWVLIGFELIVTGAIPYCPLMGILAGHIYFFFVDVRTATGHSNLLATPQFIQKMFPTQQQRAMWAAEGANQMWGGAPRVLGGGRHHQD